MRDNYFVEILIGVFMISESNAFRTLEAAMSGTADFADIFIEENKTNSVGLLNGKVNRASSSIESGVGIRLMSGTNVVYVHSNDSDIDVLIKLAKEASEALRSGNSGVIRELEEKCHTTPSSIELDPFKVNKSDIVDFLKKSSDYAFSQFKYLRTLLFTFGRRMHERYLFQSMILLLVCYMLKPVIDNLVLYIGLLFQKKDLLYYQSDILLTLFLIVHLKNLYPF